MLGSRIVATRQPHSPVRPYRLLAFGGSAGAIGALATVLSRLPAAFPIPIVVVQHLAAAATSRLPEVLGRRTSLRCEWAEDGECPLPGHVHVARPGANLVLTAAGTLLAIPGRKPRMGWPSVDLFLHSMATHLGSEAIAVILSGCLRDGADGIWAVRRQGGATMVQHPSAADYPDMPVAALDLGRADLRLPLASIAEAVLILAERGIE